MELTALRYFCTIATVSHLTRAATRLGVTQPALSAMLRKLEEEVGAELFHRTGRGVELTDAGRAFLYELPAAGSIPPAPSENLLSSAFGRMMDVELL